MTIEQIRNQIHIPAAQPGATDAASQRMRGTEAGAPQSPKFPDLLRKEIAPATSTVKFSAHAVERLASRNIILNDQDIKTLNQAVDKVAEKGGRESLLLMKNMAFVVSVENRTVITAMDGQSTQERVFTNIDSAVVV